MDALLQLRNEQWKRRQRAAGLTFFLNYSPHPYVAGRKLTRANMELEFVPAWLADDDYETPHRSLQVDISFSLPRSGDWRQLARHRLDHAEPAPAVEPVESWKLAGAESIEEIAAQVLANAAAEPPGPPDILVWSSGLKEGIQTHFNEDSLRDRTLAFGDWTAKDPFVIPFTIEGLAVTEDARQARLQLFHARLRSMFGAEGPFDPDLEIRAQQGWRLRYENTVRFDKVFCHVPVNTPDPIAYARQLARRELNLTGFGSCRINGARPDGTLDPANALSESGLLVLLTTPDPR